MNKIKEIIIGTNNEGKYREICDLLPNDIKKHSPKEFNILSPPETGISFEENSFIKASYFSKKTNLVCISDDSGLEIDILKGAPGIYSARWGGKKNNFNLAIKKVFEKMDTINKNWIIAKSIFSFFFFRNFSFNSSLARTMFAIRPKKCHATNKFCKIIIFPIFFYIIHLLKNFLNR